MRFELVRPTFETAEVIWKWRLDPEVMKNSFTFTSFLSLEDFFALFLSTHFTLPDLPPLFALVNGERAGVIRFNLAPPFNKQESVEISIIIDQSMRSKGFGTEVLRAASEIVKEKGYGSILAKIKASNLASIKAFEKAGFVKEREEGDTLEYHLYLNMKPKQEVFVIAEIGSNWVQADPFLLIEKAREAGANAVKFQVFRAETIYAKNAGSADYLNQDIESLFKELELPYEKIGKLAEACQKVGIEFMATPFSVEDFKAINPFVKRHKIASYENNHYPLLNAAIESRKPIIISTGATTQEEVASSFHYLKVRGVNDITLLQCVAAYPAPSSEMNLEVLVRLRDRFSCNVGLSDHSSSVFSAPLAAVALGATVIEKHYTLDKTLKGPDHHFALTPLELKKLISHIREVEQMIGCGYKQIEPCEIELRHFARRGIQALKEINKDDVFKEGENIASLRPGKNSQGIDPKFLFKLEGAKAKRNYKPGEGIDD